jgi:hypothetical protein
MLLIAGTTKYCNNGLATAASSLAPATRAQAPTQPRRATSDQPHDG